MNIYCVYVDSRKNNPEPIIVEQKHSFLAGVFNVIWALYHRMWWLALLLLVISLMMTPFTHLGIYYYYDISILFLITFFASELRHYHLLRKKYELHEVVAAIDEEEAELKYYSKLEREKNAV